MDYTNSLTPEQQKEALTASYWSFKFKDAMVHKAPETKRWKEYFDAYFGDYFRDEKLPEYKSNFVANYIFSIIETIRPIMLDQNPKFQALPRHPEGVPFADDLQEALNYEWDREKMMPKLSRELITTLVTGTTPFFFPWDNRDKQIKCIVINPFNLFPDPLATSVDDAEYIIYASYKNQEVLKRNFPKHAHRIQGGDIKYGELVQDNNRNARISNQVLVLEIYTRDYEREEYEKNGLKISKLKYPNGRILTICPELSVILADRPNPYDDGKFPFVLVKDYDIPGKFWGEGEVQQLLSPQKYMNELNNAIIDHAKTTANSPWILDKNTGIGEGKITSRQGLVIRKNPGSEIRREVPPNMPNYVPNAVDMFKNDMEQISGIFDSLKGNSETGVYTAQGILALQEAGQARVRLKVKLLEQALGEMACLWFSRMKQFWNEKRWIRTVKFDGTYDFKAFTSKVLEYDYDIKITAGSTMPVNRGAMLDLMIRLAQTQMPDGQALVDREAVAAYLPDEVKAPLMKRMANGNVALEQLQAQTEQLQAQLQQVVQETQANDEQTMGVIEQITGAIESINKKILQVKQSSDKMIEEQKKKEEIQKVKDQGFNEGYAQAEKLSESKPEDIKEDAKMPDDILNGLEDMSDDELQVLLMSHPDLQDLIK